MALVGKTRIISLLGYDEIYKHGIVELDHDINVYVTGPGVSIPETVQEEIT